MKNLCKILLIKIPGPVVLADAGKGLRRFAMSRPDVAYSLFRFIIVASLLVFSFGMNPGKATAQCANAIPTILETFGAGTARYNTATPESFGFTTTYIQENGGPGAQTNDGEFSFINSIVDHWGVWYGGATDHTGDPGGYMMLVNASYDPGEFYRSTVSGLCGGITYEFSVWIANLYRRNGFINPNVKFEIRDADTDELIADYVSGDIPYSPRFTWVRHSLTFTTTATSVTLLLINNNPGGVGNDIALDDIAFAPCLPQYKIMTPSAQICYGDDLDLGLSITGTPYSSPEYRWQKKIDGVWTEIVSDNQDYIHIPAATPADSGWYRLDAASAGNIANPNCSSKDSIYITVYPPAEPGSISADQLICLHALPERFVNQQSPAGSTGDFSYSWQRSYDRTSWDEDLAGTPFFQENEEVTRPVYYRRMEFTRCDTVFSDTVFVDTIPRFTPGIIAEDQSICQGEVPEPFTELRGASGGVPPYVYQWEYSDDGIDWIRIVAASGTEYQADAIPNERWYRRRVSDTRCATDGVLSNQIQLTYTNIATPVTRDTALCVGSPSFELSATGNHLSWFDHETGTTGTPVPPVVHTSVAGIFRYYVNQIVNHCESPRVPITVTIHPKPDLGINDAEICQGMSDVLQSNVTDFTGTLAYLWSPATGLDVTDAAVVRASPSTTTTYTLIVTDSEGCRDTNTSVVVVNPKPVLNAERHEICEQEQVSVHTTISHATGAVTYEWRPVSGLDNTTSPGVIANPLITTLYTIYVEDSKGCKDTSTAEITVNPKPVLTSSDTEICERAEAELSATVSRYTGTLSYEWTPATGLSSVANSTVRANPDGTTSYRVIVADSKGCRDTSYSVVTVNPKPVLSSTQAVICRGEAAVLTSSVYNHTGVVQYSWTPSDYLNSTTQATVTSLAEETIHYQTIATDEKGCKDTTMTHVTVNPLPDILIEGGDICSGNSTELHATVSNQTGPLTYQWSPATGLASVNAARVNAHPSATTTYSVTVTDANGCINSATTVVGVTTRPVADILQGDTILCPDERLTLTAFNDPAQQYSFEWLYNKPGEAPVRLGSGNSLLVEDEGYYTLEVRNEGFCPVRETVFVEIERIDVKAGASKTTLYYDEMLYLEAIGTGNILSYNWEGPEGNFSGKNVTLNPLESGMYTITVAGKKCEASDGIYITVFPPIIIPNGFSPNGDSKNDQWFIKGLDKFPHARVRIFNRWGNMVYQYNNGYHEPWQGVSESGNQLPAATYYYVIEAGDQRAQTFNGSVTILR